VGVKGAERFAFAPTKTPRSRRTLVLSPESVAVLRAHRVAQARRLVAGLELIFTTEQGTPYQQSNVRRAFKAALRAAGLPETVRIYDLRHTTASLLLEAGRPITVVSERLGHVNAAVTLAVYSHALEGQQRDAAEAMGAILRGA
jgi:integrase